MSDEIKFLSVENKEQNKHIQCVKELFIEYAAALEFDLGFQDFDKELSTLPGEYSPPFGRLFLAAVCDGIAGCVALRKISGDICEMKRLYVRPGFRRHRLGRSLAEKVITEASGIGYSKMRLDTVPGMENALSLYRSLGFREIEAYRFNPVKGAIFMELELK
jgi:ribosomal protein S18 acetylase RimI-like enzyme